MDRSLKAMLPTSSLYLLLAIAIVSYLVGYLAAQLALASSGMMMPLPWAIFLAYNICAGLAGLKSGFPGVSLSAFLGACSLRNFGQIDIDVL